MNTSNCSRFHRYAFTPPSVLPRCLRWKLQNCSTNSVSAWVMFPVLRPEPRPCFCWRAVSGGITQPSRDTAERIAGVTVTADGSKDCGGCIDGVTSASVHLRRDLGLTIGGQDDSIRGLAGIGFWDHLIATAWPLEAGPCGVGAVRTVRERDEIAIVHGPLPQA